MKTTLSFALFLITPILTFAKPIYFNTLSSTIPGAQLTHRCQTCHQTSGAQLNFFGKDFSVIKRQLGQSWQNEYWSHLQNLDSDQDGISNEDEIKMGRNPGKAEPN
jgi:cytochrome c2